MYTLFFLEKKNKTKKVNTCYYIIIALINNIDKNFFITSTASDILEKDFTAMRIFPRKELKFSNSD